MANNRATKSGFAAEAQRKVSCLLNIIITFLEAIFTLFLFVYRLELGHLVMHALSVAVNSKVLNY